MRTLSCLLLALSPVRGSYAEAGAQRILDIVRAHPGLPVGEIQKRLQLSSGTIYYHVLRLSQRGHVETRTIGRRRLVFPSTPDPLDAHAHGVLRGKTCRLIAEHILAHPGVSTSDLVDALDETPRTIYYHLKQLRENGLIASRSPTRYRDLRPTPALEGALAENRRREG